jgi:amidase
MTTAVHYLGLLELSRKLHARELSPVEAATAQLARIEQLNGQLRSYALVMAETAMAQARAAKRTSCAARSADHCTVSPLR